MEFNLLITSICFVFDLIYKMVQHTAYAMPISMRSLSIRYLPFSTNTQIRWTVNAIQFIKQQNDSCFSCESVFVWIDAYVCCTQLNTKLRSVCLCHRNMHISTVNSHLNAVSAILSIHRMRISLQQFNWMLCVSFNKLSDSIGFSVCNWRLVVFLQLNGC